MKHILIKTILFLMLQLTMDGLGADSKLMGSVLNAPNPFNLSSGTTLVYELTQPATVELMVYNPLGQRILMETYPAGTPGGQKKKMLFKFLSVIFLVWHCPKAFIFMF